MKTATRNSRKSVRAVRTPLERLQGMYPLGSLVLVNEHGYFTTGKVTGYAANAYKRLFVEVDGELFTTGELHGTITMAEQRELRYAAAESHGVLSIQDALRVLEYHRGQLDCEEV